MGGDVVNPNMHVRINEDIRGGNLQCLGGCQLGTWNVEGLTEQKIIELQNIMDDRDLGVLCMQETHRAGADYFTTDEGFLVILSGGPRGTHEYAGVGFLVSPVKFMNSDCV